MLARAIKRQLQSRPRRDAARTQRPTWIPSDAGFSELPDAPDWVAELCALPLAGHVVFHGPRDRVLPFFARLGFQLPGRKGIADFLQEVTSQKDQRVRLPSPALPALPLPVPASGLCPHDRLVQERQLPTESAVWTRSQPQACIRLLPDRCLAVVTTSDEGLSMTAVSICPWGLSRAFVIYYRRPCQGSDRQARPGHSRRRQHLLTVN